MNNLWDTTEPVFEYPNNFKKVYEKNYVVQRKSFSDWVGRISTPFKDNIDWWSSSVSSRNTFISNIFHHICILESLKILKKKNKFPNKIVVDSTELKKIINTNFNKKGKIEIQAKSKKNSLIKKVYFILLPFIYSIIIFLLSKIFINKRKIDKDNNIIIDTFITSDNLKKDRYYNNLAWKKLDNKNNIFFVPTIFNLSIFKLPGLIKQIRKSKNFVLKEDFINFLDIIYAFSYIFRKKKFYINYLSYKNINLTKLIHEEFSKYPNFQAVLISILNYCFAKNLHNKNVKLKKVINWFENTTVDKGWNFGFRKFHPRTVTIGYQGYTLYRQFMCKHPSKAEFLHKVLPEKIVVIGKAYKKIRKEFCKDIKTQVGPALRFDHLFYNKCNFKRKYNILLSLNLDISVSKKILISAMNTKWSQKGKKIFVKPHPLLPVSKIMQKEKLPKNFVELDGEFHKIARNSKIIISGGISSSIAEGLVCGCAILIPYEDINDYYNFKYLKIPKTSYKICKNTDQLDRAINFFLNEKELNRKKRIRKMELLKSILFEKTTQRNLSIFL